MTLLKKYASLSLVLLLLFCIGKALFIFQNLGEDTLSLKEILAIYGAGLGMDLSAIALFIILTLLIEFCDGILFKNPTKVADVFVYILVILQIVAIAIDSRIYKYWGFKIDREFFSYLRNPSDAAASVGSSDLLFFLFNVVLLLIPFWIYKRLINNQPRSKPKLTSLLIIIPLFVVARGGVGDSSMNQGRVYHSEKLFANYSAINPVWNLVSSYTVDQADLERYTWLKKEEVDELLNDSWSSDSINDWAELIHLGSCKNMVFIMLESFSSNLSAVTPELNYWKTKGINFENHFSSGDRSAESLTTMFTGFPAFTLTDVLDDTKRLKKLPNLFKELNARGFHTSFTYGGDVRFANLKSLLLHSKFDEIYSKSVFDRNLNTSNWGVHDEHTFDFLYKEINSAKAPFASCLFTLSSHEPFEIPRYHQKDFTNAYLYSDSCLGDFMRKLSNSPIWDSTLVIVTADHGTRLPHDYSVLDKEKFRTPLLICGGPVNSPKKFTHPVSQLGVAHLINEVFQLRSQLDYGCSLLNESQSVFYAYREGAGIVSSQCHQVFDVATNRKINSSEPLGEAKVKAYLQRIAEDMDELSRN